MGQQRPEIKILSGKNGEIKQKNKASGSWIEKQIWRKDIKLLYKTPKSCLAAV